MHEISFNDDGNAEIVTGGGVPPWHGLGVTVEEHLTARAAIEAAGLDWLVEQCPLSYNGSDLRTRVAESHVANVRSDDGRLLGIVGRGYRPVQHREQAEIVEALLGEGAAVVECLGAIRHGKRQFWCLRLPQDTCVGQADRLKRYLLVANGHDGSLSLTCQWTSIRVVCNNTLAAALREATERVTIRHTTNARSRIEHAKQVLGLADVHFRRFGEALDELAAVSVAQVDAARYFAEIIPFPADATDLQQRRVDETRQQLMRNFDGGVGAALAGATAWGLYNAATELVSHQRVFRGADPRERAERRFESLLLGGPAQQLEQRAFNSALRIARAA